MVALKNEGPTMVVRSRRWHQATVEEENKQANQEEESKKKE